jgi:hypothetical protein
MNGHHAANLLWRMENMDDRTRRVTDERAGLLAHTLRRAAGRGGARRERAPSVRSRTV